jgi:uncharacterized membrane protein YjjP (DUF1212 family)
MKQQKQHFGRNDLFEVIVGAAILVIPLAIGTLPFTTDPLTAITRTVLASLPGSFLATAIDGMN